MRFFCRAVVKIKEFNTGKVVLLIVFVINSKSSINVFALIISDPVSKFGESWSIRDLHFEASVQIEAKGFI